VEYPPQNPTVAAAFILGVTAFVAATTLLVKALENEVLEAPLHPLQTTMAGFCLPF